MERFQCQFDISAMSTEIECDKGDALTGHIDHGFQVLRADMDPSCVWLRGHVQGELVRATAERSKLKREDACML